MRRRKVQGAMEEFLNYENYAIGNYIEMAGQWETTFGNNNPIHVELGAGRGKFSVTLAEMHPEINFIAVEIKEEILIKAVEKAVAKELKNIRFICMDIKDILNVFAPDEISRIYLNFSDPWPKKRHSKRRLSYRGFLEMYKTILKNGTEIHLKTDGEELFEFSLNECLDMDFKVKNVSLDLHREDSLFDIVTTEYEERYRLLGKKIYRLEAIVRK